MRCVAAFAALLAFSLVGPAAVAAQDASPVTSPAAGACTAPPLPPGTPTPPDATPALGEAAMDATPEQLSPPVGTPAAADFAARVVAAEENLVACINARDWLALAALMTAQGRAAWGGVTNPYDLPAVAEGFGPLEAVIISVRDVQTYPDGRVSADVVFTVNGNLAQTRDYFVETDGWLLFDGYVPLPMEPAATPAP